MSKVEPRGICRVILSVNSMKDGEYAGHCGRSHKTGGYGCAALLPCNSLFHQPNIPFLLFDGAALGPQRGLEDVMQLNLIGDVVFGIEQAKAMYFCRHAQIVQQSNCSVYLSSPRVVSDEKRVIRIVNSWVSKMPSGPSMQGLNVDGGNKICPPEDNGLWGFGRCS